MKHKPVWVVLAIVIAFALVVALLIRSRFEADLAAAAARTAHRLGGNRVEGILSDAESAWPPERLLRIRELLRDALRVVKAFQQHVRVVFHLSD